jgi:hypothetical protein
MIPPKTLCLIVGDHPHAGRTCVVVAFHACVMIRQGSGISVGSLYEIDIPGADCKGFRGWGAFRRQLVPLTPPPPPKSARTDTPQRLDRERVKA